MDLFEHGRSPVTAAAVLNSALAVIDVATTAVHAGGDPSILVGEVLAARLKAGALVTGDSLGQVSSQTLVNIAALDDAVGLPILRPLIGSDKVEIMAEARRIRTLALSELPDQDCCSLLTPRHVETRARIDDLRRIEARLEAADLAEELARLAQEYRLDRV